MIINAKIRKLKELNDYEKWHNEMSLLYSMGKFEPVNEEVPHKYPCILTWTILYENIVYNFTYDNL